MATTSKSVQLSPVISISISLDHENASNANTNNDMNNKSDLVGDSVLFGPNVIVLDSTSMSIAYMQGVVDTIYKKQVDNEMGTERYCLLLLPGTYGTKTEPFFITIGYYTEIAGLGMNPMDVIIYGNVQVFNRCFDANEYYTNGTFVVTSQTNRDNNCNIHKNKNNNSNNNKDTNQTCGKVCFALNNFWRSLSNLSVNVCATSSKICDCNTHFDNSNDTASTTDTDTQRSCTSTMIWAISQASSMRRVDVRSCCNGGNGDRTQAVLSLMDYNTEPGYASGGYIADSRIDGTIMSGSQQQFLIRNLDIYKWEGSVWNQMFIGVHGAPPDDPSTFPNPPYTSLDTTPISREKPFLYLDSRNDGLYKVFVPSTAKKTSGISWADGQQAKVQSGRSISMTDFFIVHVSNTVEEMNTALSNGKHILFTPGVYNINKSIYVSHTNTVILGLGLATLTALNGIIPLIIADEPGIVVAGISVDAGVVTSDVLVQVGPRRSSGKDSNCGSGDVDNPITLSDVYFRVGGLHVGSADVSLEINSDNVLIDHIWVWRADHGVEGFDPSDGFYGDNQRWKKNIGRVGVVVNGNNVTAIGLFVEHYQQHNVVWNGNGGNVYFFQNELAYDPPTQEEWMKPCGTLGWAAYKVNDNVTCHNLWCGGVYTYNRNNPKIVTNNGFECPTHPNVHMNKTYTKNLNGPGTISNIINGIGNAVDSKYRGPSYVVKVPCPFTPII